MEQASVAAPSCVGREPELARLAELYREAHARGRRFALIEGPSGVGKSQILREFRGRMRLEGGVILEGRCEAGRAFGPFAEIVEAALRFLAEVGVTPTVDLEDLSCTHACHRFWFQHGGAADGAPAQGSTRLEGSEVEAQQRRMRLFDAIHGLLVDVARVRPPVVILHDLERADLGTHRLLDFVLDGMAQIAGELSTGADGLRALFVASVRSDAPTADVDYLRAHDATVSLPVGRLSVEGVRAYLQSPETVARVLRRTGGMPEAIDLLLQADPLTPEELLDRQLLELPVAARKLVEALSVVEPPAELDLLARVAGVAVDAADRQAFGASDLVSQAVSDGRILFSLARSGTRERVVETMPLEHRRALHARCAEIFAERPEHALEAARHAIAAEDFDRAVPLSLDAARSLSARHAHAEAAALLEDLVASRDAADVPTNVHEHLADLYRLSGQYRMALAHAEAVRGRAPQSAAATRRVGDLLTLAGRLDDAAEMLVAAHRLATAADDPAGRTEVGALLAELHFQRASYDEARQWAERALAAAEAFGELTLEIHARNTLGKLALVQMRDAAEASALFERNRAYAEEAGLGHQLAQALTNLGVAMLRRQDLDGAREAFEQAIVTAKQADDARECAIATKNLAVHAHLQRDYDTALGYYHDAVSLLKRLGNRAMLARTANNLGELYLTLGERRRARALCEFATHMGGTDLPMSVAAEGLLLRGRVEAADGNGASARASFEAARSAFEELSSNRVCEAALEIARAALADGNVVEARQMLGALPIQESPKAAAEVTLLAVDIERAAGEASHRTARRAVRLAQDAGDDQLLMPALVRLARALHDEGDLGAASRAVARALEVEARLSARVPEEASTAWAARPDREDLAAIEGALRHAIDDVPHLGTAPPARARVSSIPPPAPRVRRADWQRRYPHIVGTSAVVESVLGMLDKVAPTDALVLVRGESGTGKELVAEALHDNSPRRDRPLVKVNCAALVETLLLSELFGHERGAFTGASARKKGRFEMADGGTIFLDEIGDISPKTQVALLRVLQERCFERVGGTQSIRVDVRIVAATHRDLEQMVRDGRFREDLYYRLRGVTIEMPALRRRLDDIEPLCRHLLGRIADERGDTPHALSLDALHLLQGHAWPGNVRELENVLRSATLFADSDTLFPADFAAFAETFRAREAEPEPELARAPSSAPAPSVEDQLYDRIREGEGSLLEMKKVLERECIVRALSETGGNITRAAQLLGMKRPRLSQLVKQYDLQTPTVRERS